MAKAAKHAHNFSHISLLFTIFLFLFVLVASYLWYFTLDIFSAFDRQSNAKIRNSPGIFIFGWVRKHRPTKLALPLFMLCSWMTSLMALRCSTVKFRITNHNYFSVTSETVSTNNYVHMQKMQGIDASTEYIGRRGCLLIYCRTFVCM